MHAKVASLVSFWLGIISAAICPGLPLAATCRKLGPGKKGEEGPRLLEPLYQLHPTLMEIPSMYPDFATQSCGRLG